MICRIGLHVLNVAGCGDYSCAFQLEPTQCNNSLSFTPPPHAHIHTLLQFECEFRRFSVDRTQTSQFDAFYSLVKDSHHLPSDMPFTVSYTDPRNGDLLPITNSDNLMRAYTTAMPLLRLVIYRKQGVCVGHIHSPKYVHVC